MTVAGIRLSDEAVLAKWPGAPKKFTTPDGDIVMGAQVGWTDGTYKLVNYVVVDNPPSKLHEKVSETPVLSGNTMTVTYNYSPPADNASNRAKYEQLIDAEKRRRLRLGGNVTLSGGTANINLRTDFDFAIIMAMALHSTTGNILYADADDTVFNLTPADRQTLLEAAVNRERYLETKAYALRQLSTMAPDYDDDSYWT